MSDVNLYSPDSMPRPAREQGSTRSSGSPTKPTNSPETGEGKQGVKATQAADATGNTKVARAEKRNEAMREQLGEAVSQLNDYVQSVERGLEFEVDDDTGQTMVRVIDRQTSEVVRQIPDELAVRLAENLQQDEPLSLLNIRV